MNILNVLKKIFTNDLIITGIEAPLHVPVVKVAPTKPKQCKPLNLSRYKSWRDIRKQVEPTLIQSQQKTRDKFIEKQLKNTNTEVQ